MLEYHIRCRVATIPNICIRDSCEAVGLMGSTKHHDITGVRVHRMYDNVQSQESLDTNLVIDATGRGSQVPRWLAMLGYPFSLFTKCLIC